MISISICVGSACHLQGAHGVLNAFNLLVERHRVSVKIDIAGNFCQGLCTEGVVIKINDEIIKNVSKAKVHEIFTRKVLGCENDEDYNNAKSKL